MNRLAQIASAFALSVVSFWAHAEFTVVARDIELPPDLAALREHQERIAQQENFNIKVADRKYVSGTLLDGVPDGLKDVAIKGTEDLPALAERLFDYYGKLGEESLELARVRGSERRGEMTYQLAEYIGGLETEGALRITVKEETGEILKIDGWLHHDRGFDRVPSMPREDAIQIVVNATISAFTYHPSPRPMPTYPGDHKARVILLTWTQGEHDVIVPAWHVELDPSVLENKDFGIIYMVAPDGRAVPADPFFK